MLRWRLSQHEEIKRGVLQAGGFPVEVPVMSLGEMLMKTHHNALSQFVGDETRKSCDVIH